MVTKTENKNPALELGSKIRALRQRLKRTLDDTATAARISKPFLSQVERGLATPSLTSLAGIASALGVTVQYFVDTPSEERSVSRGDQLRFFGFADSANLFARLTNVTGGRQLEAILVKMPPGQKRSEVNTHAGERWKAKPSRCRQGTALITNRRFRIAGPIRRVAKHSLCGSERQDCFNGRRLWRSGFSAGNSLFPFIRITTGRCRQP
jgi:transcriptional regulator with XRE-family HTH domain